MACCSSWHKKLDEKGVGKCSAPIWRNGLPASFCDKPAYGNCIYSDRGYVPYLACYAHVDRKITSIQYLQTKKTGLRHKRKQN